MKVNANNLDGWTGGSPIPTSLSFDSRFPTPWLRFPPLTFFVLPLPCSPYSRFIPCPRLPNSRFPPPYLPVPATHSRVPDPRPPSQFNADLFYYPLVELDTNSHNHILQSLTMVTFLNIHKLTVPYREADTGNSKLPAVT